MPTIARLGGIGLILFMIVGAFSVALNAIANPASPANPPSITISDPFSAPATAIVPASPVPLPVVDYSAQADAAMESVAESFRRIQPLEANLQQGKIIHEGLGPITWVVSSGLMQCFVNITIWAPRYGQTFGYDNSDKPKTSPCDKDFVQKAMSELIRKGIEIGIPLELVNEVGEFVMKSISAKFGW